VPQQHREGDGGGELEQELGPGGQAGVLLFLHLLVVVQVADDPEHQRETENEQSPEVPRAMSVQPMSRRVHRMPRMNMSPPW
jgi:hypothetical protein